MKPTDEPPDCEIFKDRYFYAALVLQIQASFSDIDKQCLERVLKEVYREPTSLLEPGIKNLSHYNASHKSWLSEVQNAVKICDLDFNVLGQSQTDFILYTLEPLFPRYYALRFPEMVER